jgi:electron transfer flavoprotein alpha subunit/transcriptional regulator with XRE-family HTH domain
MTNTYENDIWVFGDLRNNRLLGYSLNTLAAAKSIAEPISGSTTVVIFTGNPDETTGLPLKESIEEFISRGADKVSVVENSKLIPARGDILAQAFTEIIEERQPKAVLFPFADLGREIASRCARRFNAGIIADCAEFKIKDGSIIASCPSWGGEIMAELTFSNPKATGFATVQPHAFQPCEKRGNPGEVERISIKSLYVSDKLKILSSNAEPAERRRLEDADIVVAGGAGMGSLEGFRLVRDLSAALGGEVGATRPPVLSHWVDEERLIGQTGKTINPRLLLSIGTSGAIQYTAGITESNTIVAINRDPNSPIFQVADIGIVADAKLLLPLVTEKVKQEVMRDLADVLTGDRGEDRDEGFGTKLLTLRESQGWSIEELAEKTNQSPEHLKRVEENEIVPSVSFLLRLSRALNVDPGTFLRDEEKSAIKDQRAQAFIKRTKNYNYQTLTPGAENEHLRGFMISIEPNQDLKPVAYKHEGEEFIYVMEGDLEVTLDNKKNLLKTGESIHFNSETPHKLKSMSKETTRCLVVLYTP